jgi:hypothetical protein
MIIHQNGVQEYVSVSEYDADMKTVPVAIIRGNHAWTIYTDDKERVRCMDYNDAVEIAAIFKARAK